ncbi:MAG TPA: glycosyltransferase family 2 protein [Holophagaceae bacterium]|nr:glycosyltransferase family 2 protein [Holophagaceae bacterium]
MKVGICVLNYHHPHETAHCVEILLRKEPATSRILWIENDSEATEAGMRAALAQAPFPWVVLDPEESELPAPGVVGVLLSPKNLGYAGGNNLGLRRLHRAGVPYAWVLNNDTELMEGCSEDLVAAAEARPEVGAWGAAIHAVHRNASGEIERVYLGGIVSQRDFGIKLAESLEALEQEPFAYVSGCSLFSRLSTFAEVGFIPDDYFLYYEDPAFTYELKKRGYAVSGLTSVRIYHLESLATGRRSPLMEYYNRRNRWVFIERYHPEALKGQKKRFWYTFQKYLFRLRLERIHEEWIAYQDYRKGRLGPTVRNLSRSARG